MDIKGFYSILNHHMFVSSMYLFLIHSNTATYVMEIRYKYFNLYSAVTDLICQNLTPTDTEDPRTDRVKH